MADYLVAGWWTDFSFLLTPDELKQVLKSYHLVIYNAHMPVGYTETPITKLTMPLYVMENGDKRKTNVRVSAEVKERLQGALLMKDNGFIMV